MNENPEYSSLLGKIAAYTEILIKDPYSTIFVSLAETYRKLGLFDDAHQILLKGLEKHDDFAPAYIVQGRIFCQQGQYEQSVDAFEKSLQLESESLAALVGYARVLILHERFSYARELLLRARSLSPADPVINKLLISLPEDIDIIISEADEESDENIDVSDQDAEEQNTTSLISVTLGDLYLKQGLVNEALKVFRQLSSQDPENLNLRRRIKEAEALLVDEQVRDSDSSLEEKMTVDVHTAEDDDHKSREMDSPNELSVDANIINGDESQAETTVETLQRWLANIERRRKHV